MITIYILCCLIAVIAVAIGVGYNVGKSNTIEEIAKDLRECTDGNVNLYPDMHNYKQFRREMKRLVRNSFEEVYATNGRLMYKNDELIHRIDDLQQEADNLVIALEAQSVRSKNHGPINRSYERWLGEIFPPETKED